MLCFLDFSGKFKSFFRRDERNKLINHCRSRNGALHDLNQFRSGIQRGTDDAGKHKRNARMRQQCQAEIFSDSIRHEGKFCAGPCPKIFSECARSNVDKGIQPCAEDQVIVQRSTQINDYGEQRDAQDR